MMSDENRAAYGHYTPVRRMKNDAPSFEEHLRHGREALAKEPAGQTSHAKPG